MIDHIINLKPCWPFFLVHDPSFFGVIMFRNNVKALLKIMVKAVSDSKSVYVRVVHDV